MSKVQVLIENVDDCIDRFYSNKLNDINFFIEKLFRSFPKCKEKHFEGFKNSTVFRYMTARMAACHHSAAEGFVYAFNYKNPSVSEHSRYWAGSYAEDMKELSLDKIGMSENPTYRRRGIKCPVSGLKYNHTIAIFPIKRWGGALALESAILGSLSEDNMSGEWFYSSIGIWKALVRWHIACFGFDN